MCLTIPGRLVTVDTSDPSVSVGIVDYAGVRRNVNLLYVPEARPGDYVLVHAGFATQRLPEEEAREAIACARAANELATSTDTTFPAREKGSPRDTGGGSP